MFDAPEISVATPLLEIVRDPTLDQLLTDAFRGDGPVRCELDLNGLQIELHAVATRNESREITGALVLFHDITELKKIDQVRRDFVANVSHELRRRCRSCVATSRRYSTVQKLRARSSLEFCA